MTHFFTIGLLFDIEYIVKNIYELVKKVIQYKDSTVKKKEKKRKEKRKENMKIKWINIMFM